MFIGRYNAASGISDNFAERDDPYSLHIKFKDLAGNETIIETADNPTFYIDRTAPTLNVFAIEETLRDTIINGSINLNPFHLITLLFQQYTEVSLKLLQLTLMSKVSRVVDPICFQWCNF